MCVDAEQRATADGPHHMVKAARILVENGLCIEEPRIPVAPAVEIRHGHSYVSEPWKISHALSSRLGGSFGWAYLQIIRHDIVDKNSRIGLSSNPSDAAVMTDNIEPSLRVKAHLQIDVGRQDPLLVVKRAGDDPAFTGLDDRRPAA